MILNISPFSCVNAFLVGVNVALFSGIPFVHSLSIGTLDTFVRGTDE